MSPLWEQPALDDLPGRTVVTADGDELGVVAAVRQTTNTAPDGQLVVTVRESVEPAVTELVVAEQRIHTVTEHDVVLGTTTAFLFLDQEAGGL